MARILVTGGAGFIGSSLIATLLQSNDNHNIIAYDNLSSGKLENITNWRSKSNFDFIEADMLDDRSLEKAVNNCTIVFHLAANSDVAVGEKNTKIDFEQNVISTYNLLEAMRKSQECKRVIFASTSAIYGESHKIPISENYSPLKPISLYGSSKLACESLISGYCHMFNIAGTIARLANITGSTSQQGVIYDFISKLLSDPNHLDILGNGEQNKSYLHISDCIDAMVTLFETQEKEIPAIFNVGSDDKITVSGIADMLIQELGLRNVERNYIDNHNGRGWTGDIKEFLLDSSKIKNLGWNPKYNSKDAIIQTVRDFLKTIDRK
ncbi:MAG TPA: GDP-mannose 4,6-dehydratase [Nitrososphaeraceae archaeon]|nr:GDP-mannose 4,6-dehydratase [Nitrososphaeraceae archaeon]